MTEIAYAVYISIYDLEQKLLTVAELDGSEARTQKGQKRNGRERIKRPTEADAQGITPTIGQPLGYIHARRDRLTRKNLKV